MADPLRPLGNDPTAAAEALALDIGDVSEAIETSPGYLSARMPGSGATCFGLYAEPAGVALAPVVARPEGSRAGALA